MHSTAGVKNTTSNSPSKTTTENTSSQQGLDASEKLQEDAEGMVFHPVVRGPLKTRFEVSREAGAMRVVSPTEDDSSSSCSSGSSPLDSLSDDLSDDKTVSNSTPSVTTAAVSTRRVVRHRHKRSSRENRKQEFNQKLVKEEKEFSDHPKHEGSSVVPELSQLHIHAYSESSTDDEGTPVEFSPPRGPRRQKLPPGGPPPNRDTHEVQVNDEPQGPKIVGILKKLPPGGLDKEEGKQSKCVENGLAPASAVTSCASSAASSVLTQERNHGNGDRYSAIGGGSRVARDTISMSSASTTKRVRFSDNFENSSLGSSHTSTSRSSTPHIDSAVELWKRVLPNERYSPPNGMYTPRMKVTLSKRGASSHIGQPKQTQEHITVHIPRPRGPSHVERDRRNDPSFETDERCDDDSKKSEEVAESGGGGSREGGAETGWMAKRSQGWREREGERGGEGEVLKRSKGWREREGERGGEGEVLENSGVTTQGAVNRGNYEVLHEDLDKSPTDEQIDGAWDEIQMQLYARPGDKVTLAPQVYKFQPGPPKGAVGTVFTQGHDARQHYSNGKYCNLFAEGDTDVRRYIQCYMCKLNTCNFMCFVTKDGHVICTCTWIV